MAVEDGTSAVTTADDDRYPRRLLLTVISAVTVFSSSMTIVSASLPTMAEDLDSSASLLSWSVTGLFLVMAVATPVLGRLGDVHGHRRVFLRGAIVLGIGTAFCAIAPTALAFVLARMVAGAGIAATMPNGIALIMETYPLHRRSEAMGWWSMAMTGAPVIGLIVGGPLIEAFGWRSVFVVLTPISALGVVLSWRVIRPSPRGPHVPIDVAGAVALATATLSFLLWLEFGGSRGFTDPLAVVLAVVAVGALGVFLHLEKTVQAPMLRLDYFHRPNFRGPLIAQPTAQFAYMGGFLIAPLLLDELFGYTVAGIALVLLFRPGVYSMTSPVGGRLAMVTGERSMILSGSILMVLSMLAWAGAAIQGNIGLVILGLALSGLAMGLASPSYATAVAGSVEPRDLGMANGIASTMMNIGMLTGIQAMFTVLGDGREPSDFATVFLFGGAVAALGIVGGAMVRPTLGSRHDGPRASLD